MKINDVRYIIKGSKRILHQVNPTGEYRYQDCVAIEVLEWKEVPTIDVDDEAY